MVVATMLWFWPMKKRLKQKTPTGRSLYYLFMCREPSCFSVRRTQTLPRPEAKHAKWWLIDAGNLEAKAKHGRRESRVVHGPL